MPHLPCMLLPRDGSYQLPARLHACVSFPCHTCMQLHHPSCLASHSPPLSLPPNTHRAREHLPHLACLGLALTAFNDSPTICASLAALKGQLTRLVLGVKDYRGGEALQLSELTGEGLGACGWR